MPFTVPASLQDSTNIVLKSADAVEFRVHSMFLSQASTAFESMFLLPQAPATSSPSDELCSVSLAESGDVLSVLLMCIYPVEKTTVESVIVLRGALKAARKYDMDSAFSILRKDMTRPHLLHTDPLAVYSMACTLGLKMEAQEAAVETLKWSVNNLASRMDSIGEMLGQDFARLLNLRRVQAENIHRVIDQTSTGMRTTCNRCKAVIKEWSEMAKAEVLTRPVGEKIFSLDFILKPMTSSKACSCARDKDAVVYIRACKETIQALKVPSVLPTT